MPWRKDRPSAPGELEFHLPSERTGAQHDDAWRHARAEKLTRRHPKE